MSYLAKIKAKSRPSGTDKTDKTPVVDSSVSSVSPPQAHIGEKNITRIASSKDNQRQADPKSQTTDERRPDPALLQALARVVDHLPLTAQAIYAELSDSDIDAWRDGALNRDNLRAFALAVHEGHEREAGRIPDSYQDIANCDQCGPVWLFMPGDVPSCPWCINRYNGWPIPRPGSVTCATCRHFQRTEHPHLGHCSAGIKPYGVAGHWDTDRHGCKHWLSA